MSAVVLHAHELDRLLQALQDAGYHVVGPRRVDNAIIYDTIEQADDLPQGWTDDQEKGRYRLRRREDQAYFGYVVGPHSWKKYLHPPRRQLWQAVRGPEGMHIESSAQTPPRLAFLGVRSCELHAMAIQDRVFLDGDDVVDDYQRRRENCLTVALNCTTAAPTCFCTSMGTGPAVNLPSDLCLTELISSEEHCFLLRNGTPAGRAILDSLRLPSASPAQLQREVTALAHTTAQVQAGPRTFDNTDTKTLLYRNFDSPVWDQLADRCLSCANCTLACPTCFCTTVEDSTDLRGDHAERWEQWASCFTDDFSHIHGGPVRADTSSRYRQWMTHKLATWWDQFGTSGCVGCGRCISWCPVGIDITETLSEIREAESP